MSLRLVARTSEQIEERRSVKVFVSKLQNDLKMVGSVSLEGDGYSSR
jgi:hypothetical protein